MRKIPTLFVRDESNKAFVTEVVTPGLEWVLDGRCIAREKLDGTACAVLDGRLYRRHTWRAGTLVPEGFIPSGPANYRLPKVEGWVPVGEGPQDAAHRAAFNARINTPRDGTYELVGPKVQSNPYGLAEHELKEHAVAHEFVLSDLSFIRIRTFLERPTDSFGNIEPIEGLVFWGPEGPVAKIKRTDYGLPWPVGREA